MSEKLLAEYRRLCHAMQSGVAFKMEKEPSETQPKHLRVGINTAMSDHGALVALLIEKGVFTSDEYAEKLVEFMRHEVNMYKEELSCLYGGPVDLA